MFQECIKIIQNNGFYDICNLFHYSVAKLFMFNCFDCFLCSLIGLIVYGPLVIKFPVFLPSSPEVALLPGSAQAQAELVLLLINLD